MRPDQPSLFAEPPPLPEGLSYRPNFLSAEEERTLVVQLEALAFTPFQFHGFEGKRRTVSFGWHYAFDGSGLKQTNPIPDWLRPVRDRAETFAGLKPGALEHALIIEYGEGAGIGWHKDRPVFADVVGVSLLSAAQMRFRRKAGEKWQRAALDAQPRSAYLLCGPAREEWEHSIPGVEMLRYSITFRSLRRRP